jgi:hypothetical protein
MGRGSEISLAFSPRERSKWPAPARSEDPATKSVNVRASPPTSIAVHLPGKDAAVLPIRPVVPERVLHAAQPIATTGWSATPFGADAFSGTIAQVRLDVGKDRRSSSSSWP